MLLLLTPSGLLVFVVLLCVAISLTVLIPQLIKLRSKKVLDPELAASPEDAIKVADELTEKGSKWLITSFRTITRPDGQGPLAGHYVATVGYVVEVTREHGTSSHKVYFPKDHPTTYRLEGLQVHDVMILQRREQPVKGGNTLNPSTYMYICYSW